MYNSRVPVTCPKCGHRQPSGNECAACGVIISKAMKASTGFVERREYAPVAQWSIGSPLEALVTGTDALLIEQHPKSWWEILFDWEQRNEYAIADTMNRARGWVVEQGVGFGAALRRVFLGSHRPLDLAVFSPGEREIVLNLDRPFYWFFSDMAVVTGEGRKIGSVEQRLGIIRRKYELKDATGQIFARISSPLFRIWTFPVFDHNGIECAVISKTWAGLLQEWMTDADKFTVKFTQPSLTVEQRAIVFAAALTIDYDFFENNQKRS